MIDDMIACNHIKISLLHITYTMAVHHCPKCPLTFPTKQQLDQHLARKTPCNAGNYKCSKCDKGLKTAKTLRRHEKKCEGKTPTLGELQAQLAQVHAEKDADAQTRTEEVAEPSQPPVDAPLAIIDQAGFFEFDNKKIRKTSEIPQRVSVYDLIAAITDQDANNARTNFIRRKEEHSEIAALCSLYKFSGKGNLTSPVTDAQGAVLIMNLLPGKKAAEFRKACAGIIVRYLGGDETLVGEIKRNQVIQETALETNPVRFFGSAVVSAAAFHKTSSLELESATGFVAFRAPSIYMRQVHDKVSNLHPIGRPQDVLTPEQLAEVAIVKIGSQGGHTGRQMTHNKYNYNQSKLLDSKLTTSFTHAETQAKDIWRNNGELYEGLFEGKTTRDVELLVVKNQEDYERQVNFYHNLCPAESIPLELQLAQEKTKQSAIDADVRKTEIEAEARKADAEARKAEAEARKVEAEARKIELEIVKMQNMKNQV